MDKALLYGKVGCFCTQNCWDTGKGRWMWDIFRERGNLATVFNPREAELTPGTNHIVFEADDLRALDAVVVEIQDVGIGQAVSESTGIYSLVIALLLYSVKA